MLIDKKVFFFFFENNTLLVYFIFLYIWIDRAFKLVCLFTFSVSAILSEIFDLITFFECLHLVCPTFSHHLSLRLSSLSFSRRLFRLFALLHVLIFLYLSLQQVTLHPRIVVMTMNSLIDYRESLHVARK